MIFIYIYIPTVTLGSRYWPAVEFPGTLRDDKLEIPNIPGEHHYSALGKETFLRGLVFRNPTGWNREFGSPSPINLSIWYLWGKAVIFGWWQLIFYRFLSRDSKLERIQFGLILFQIGLKPTTI